MAIKDLNPKKRITRRKFLTYAGYTLAAMFASGLGGVHYITRVEPAWVEITRPTFRLKNLHPAFSGFRIVQLSDIHLGGWMNRARLETVVQAVIDLKPDLVALTGDYITGHSWSRSHEAILAVLQETLQPLARSAQTVAVLGNHDHWTRARRVRETLTTAGIATLANTALTLRQSGQTLHIAGVDDIYAGQDRIDRVLHSLPADGAAILLAHEPDFADTSAQTGRFDLQLSGHSHGGQIVIPFYGPPMLPYLGTHYPSGLYQVGDMLQYTNRGVGMARLPVRFNCRPEITEITLAPA